MPGLAPQRQVRRRLSARSLLPGRWPGRRHRAAGHRSRQAAVRRRARQRAAVFGQPGQHGRVLRAARARRHRAGHGAEPGRPPDARQPGQLLGQAATTSSTTASILQSELIDYDRVARLGPRAQAEADRRRRLGLFAHHRLAALPRDRRQRRRAVHGRHRPHRRPGRGGRASQPGAVRRRRDDHDPQEPARPARRADPVASKRSPRTSIAVSSPASRVARTWRPSPPRQSAFSRRSSPSSATTSSRWSTTLGRWPTACVRGGMQLVSGGTDNHLLVVKLLDRDYSGKALARALESAGIITSMSTVPGETRKPAVTSGVRFGTPGDHHARRQRKPHAARRAGHQHDRREPGRRGCHRAICGPKSKPSRASWRRSCKSMRGLLALLLLNLVAAALAASGAMAQAGQPEVVVGEIKGIINPVMAGYVDRVISDAEQIERAGRRLLHGHARRPVRRDARHQPAHPGFASPGHRLRRARRSARGSAGVYISYAAHLVGMAPATNIGSATPVAEDSNGGEAQMSPEMKAKVTNDAVAGIRALAEQRGRDPDFAERAVREGANLQASEALKSQRRQLHRRRSARPAAAGGRRARPRVDRRRHAAHGRRRDSARRHVGARVVPADDHQPDDRLHPAQHGQPGAAARAVQPGLGLSWRHRRHLPAAGVLSPWAPCR